MIAYLKLKRFDIKTKNVQEIKSKEYLFHDNNEASLRVMATMATRAVTTYFISDNSFFRKTVNGYK